MTSELHQQAEAVGRRGFSGLSITAFILSLFGFVLGVPALIGLVLGIVALLKSKHSSHRRGLAIAATVISAIWLAIFALILAVSGSGETSEDFDAASVENRMEEIRELQDDGPGSAEGSIGTQSGNSKTSGGARSPAPLLTEESGSFMTSMAQSLFEDLSAQEQLSACNTYQTEGRLFASWELVTFLTLPSRMSTPLSDSDRQSLTQAMGDLLAAECG